MPKSKQTLSVASVLAMLGAGLLVLLFNFILSSTQRLALAQVNTSEVAVTPDTIEFSEKSPPTQTIVEEKSGATTIYNELKEKTLLTAGSPFWIQLIGVIQNNHDEDNNGHTTDGIVLPKHYIEEQWIFVGGDLNQIRGVYSQRPFSDKMDQSNLQTDVVRIAWDTNSAQDLLTNKKLTVDPGPAEKFSIPDYGFKVFSKSFTEELPVTNSSGQPVKNIVSATEVEMTTLNGHKVAMFTTNSSQDSPTQFGQYKQPVVGMTMVGYFDLETGYLLRIEQILLFADGNTRLASTLDLTINIQKDPTQQVLLDLSKLEATK